jgi:hypothetical protein
MKWVRQHPFLSAIAGFLLLVIAVVAISNGFLISANKKRLDAITARGEPVTLAGLDKFYKAVPDGSNAALVWLQGHAALSPDLTGFLGTMKSPQRGTRMDPEQLRMVTALLVTNKEALEFFHRAASLPRSRYPISLNQIPFTNWQHFSDVKGAATVLGLEAMVACEETNSARAVEAITGIFAAGHSLANEPVLLSQLVRYAIDFIGVRTLQSALNGVAFTESELAGMQLALSKVDDPESVSRGLVGERAFFIAALSDPAGYLAANRGRPPSGFGEIVSDVFVQPLTQFSGFWRRDLRFGIDALTTNIAWARLPDPQRFYASTNMPAMAAQATSGRYILTALFLPALDKFVLRDASHRAQARTALVALAIERFRLANNGKLPDQLSSLVPKYLDKVPVDPFDGKPVRFKQLKTGYVVYCIGADEKDDGGAERVPNAPKGSPEDVTFIVERP